MSKTTILYKDIAPGAEEDAVASSSSAYPNSDLSLVPTGTTSAPTITLELNHWGLDGMFDYEADQKIAFWSNDLSGDDCVFSNPPEITVSFDEQYTSMGIYLIFDTATGGYCPSVTIKWYQGELLKQSTEFSPDSNSYFCSQLVESYDRIVVTLNSTNLPQKRARIEQILFGVYRTFDMTEIRSASIVNEMSLSGLELPVSTFDWTLNSRDDIEYMFQIKQPIEVRNNENLIGVYYIDDSSRKGKHIYSISCHDALGVLDESTFTGGVYENKSAKELLSEIIGEDFEIDFSSVFDTQLTGAILSGTRREAIQQVIFAWGVYLATDGGDKIRVFSAPVSGQEIDKDHTSIGVSVTTSSVVTEVRVTAHKYTQASDGGTEINGVKYNDETTVYTIKNPNVTANDKQNIKEVTGGTLVSPDIGQTVAQRVYDYYTRRNMQSAKIVWNGEKLGDMLTIPNPWDSTNTGNVQKMEIKLSNTVLASVESLGV